jgi:hypothetical protein
MTLAQLIYRGGDNNCLSKIAIASSVFAISSFAITPTQINACHNR